MFDTMQVARTIREARISKNMTQMNLADAMEVSYQAVSNWERGNSMPDIAKLEQLCQLLDISIETLLGTGSSSGVISKIIYKEEMPNPSAAAPADSPEENAPLTIEEICDVAPLLPPSDVEEMVDNSIPRQSKETLDLSAITPLAPFLAPEYLNSLVQRVHVDSLKEIVCIAPFLSRDTLDSLIMDSSPEYDMNGIIALAPFLSGSTLNKLVFEKLHVATLRELTGLAPFLSRETLDVLVARANPECDMKGIIALAPFLSSDTLNKLVFERLHVTSLRELAGLAPFLSRETLDILVERADPEQDMSGISALAPFLSKDTLNRLVDRIIDSGPQDGLSGRKLAGLYPFLSQDSLQRIAEELMKKRDLEALKNITPFV